MSLFGAPDVLGLEARRDVEGLARALRYKSGNAGAEHQVVRAAAARALSRIGDARAVKPLIAALIDKDGSSVHSAEAEALGQIGDVRGVGPLVAVLAGIDSDSSLREAAIIALGEIGDASAVPPLIATLNDEIARVREAAAVALGEIGDVGALEALISNLADADKDVRRSIATALGKLGDARAAAPLIVAFDDPVDDVRRAAADAVVQLGGGAIEPLTAALKARNGQVRIYASKALVEVFTASGNPALNARSGTVESLVECLGSRDAALRESAARLLGKIGDARAIKALVGTLTNDSPDVVQAAAEALRMLRWKPDKTAAGAAYWASQTEFGKCVEMGPVAIPSLVTALGDRHRAGREAARQALIQIGATAVESIIDALADGAKPVRTNAALALGEIGDLRSVRPLIARLADRDEDVRLAARRALIQIGGPAVEPLIGALRDSHDWEIYVCELGAQALVQIGAPAVEPLIAALGDQDPLLRWTAAEALGKIGDRRAVAPLVAALRDLGLRQAASEALGMLGWKSDTTEARAAYPMTALEPAKCAENGAPAGKPLVAVFEDRDDNAGPDTNLVIEPFVPALDD